MTSVGYDTFILQGSLMTVVICLWYSTHSGNFWWFLLLLLLFKVRKTRWLYLVGQTRVHCDHVEGLGNFAELEVVLEDQQVTPISIFSDLFNFELYYKTFIVVIKYITLLNGGFLVYSRFHPQISDCDWKQQTHHLTTLGKNTLKQSLIV